ncbi:MAG: DUF4143 domain-containing protein [Fibromonadaceae bacterium]|jgi:predicted AAA+ superfamily ATPase|nr:DUF4143 domain-containing protein [Fibromonadaceae bacterium]
MDMFLQQKPMSFFEFLKALGKEELHELAGSNDFKSIAMHNKEFEEMLKLYFFIGGMPQAVQVFLNTKNLDKVRKTQKELIKNCELGFIKHANSASKVSYLWNSIPEQLVKGNKKFIYSKINTGEKSAARSSTYEEALKWLEEHQLVYAVKDYYESGTFKLYMHDVGILGAKYNLDEKTLLKSDRDLFSFFNGALVEQFVLQELRASGQQVFYWNAKNSSAEVEFLLDKGSAIPLEVKSDFKTQAKSLSSYITRYKPIFSIKISTKKINYTNKVYSIPLYLICRWSY